MKNRLLGKTGLETSELGFGCMGLNYHRGPAKDRGEMISVIHAVLDSSITMLDTAEVYGPYTNEEIVGEALAGRRDKVHIATKCGFRLAEPGGGLDSRPETMRKSIEGSLKRLRTDYIDLYYIHRVDPNVPIEDVAYQMKRFREEGKILHWGLSEAGVETIRKAHAVEPLAAVENEYSMWFRTPEAELFPVLEELGIGMVAYSPLGRGYLTGTLKPGTDFSQNDNRADLPRFTKEAMEANQVVLDLISSIAAEKNVTPAQIALAWVLAQKPWIVPIPGTTKKERVLENNAAADISFSPEELAGINDALSKINVVGDRYSGETSRMTGK